MTVEYGRKPYLSRSHGEMMRRITDKQINDQKLLRQSEMKKPYINSTYQEMEHFYPPPWGDNPDNPYPYFPEPPAPYMRPVVIGDKCKELAETIFSGLKTMQDKVKATLIYNKAGCPVKILCAGLSVAFTTKYIDLGESMTFTVTGSLVTQGLVYISWSLSGPGSLSNLTRVTSVYTAPEEPTSCDNSQAVLTVKCNGFDKEKINIIINNPSVAGTAYETKSITGGSGCCYYPPGYCAKDGSCLGYNCGPVRLFTCTGYTCAGVVAYTCNGRFCEDIALRPFYSGCVASPGYVNCGYSHVVGNTDLRTEAMKEIGCCPGALY